MTVASYAEEQQAIMSRLQDNWDEDVPIAWPNERFDPLAAGNDVEPAEEYIVPVVNRQEAFNADINAASRRIRHPGLLTVNVRVRVNTGDGRALELADAAAGIFRNANFDGIHFRAPTVRDLGAEGEWYRVQVDCPYWRDSIH